MQTIEQEEVIVTEQSAQRKYVAGFVFNKQHDCVVLIKKTHPEWQRGLLNGVGGKVENNETFVEAMARECTEECGLVVPEEDWNPVCDLLGCDYRVRFFATATTDILSAHTVTDESVLIVSADCYDDFPCVQNLAWLIPMTIRALEGRWEFYTIQEIDRLHLALD